jgi:hypothetical protein
MTAKVCSTPVVVPARPGMPGSAEALLERMRRTAVRELARHVPEGALCVWCGEVWPCDRARLADLALS